MCSNVMQMLMNVPMLSASITEHALTVSTPISAVVWMDLREYTVKQVFIRFTASILSNKYSMLLYAYDSIFVVTDRARFCHR